MGLQGNKRKDIRYYWGVATSDQVLPKEQNKPYNHMNYMVSAWDFTKFASNFEKLSEGGIRKYLGLCCNDSRKIMMDSGGFKGYSQDVELDPSDILTIYDVAKLHPQDYAISLDRVPFPNTKPAKRMAIIKKNNEVFSFMNTKNPQVINTIHGWSRKELETSLSVSKDMELISIPSYFTMLTNTKKDENGDTIKISPAKSFRNKENNRFFQTYFSTSNKSFTEKLTIRRLMVKRFLDFVHLYQEFNLDSRVHVLGMSASLAMHIFAYTGIFCQFDSANWRVKANHSKIQFGYRDSPVAEAYIGKKEINYGQTIWKDGYDQLLMQCECPVCKGKSLDKRKDTLSDSSVDGFQDRAIHNAFHYQLEINTANDLLGTEKYFRFIENRVKTSSGFYKLLWNAIKKLGTKTQTSLDIFL